VARFVVWEEPRMAGPDVFGAASTILAAWKTGIL
jgi:hypothetical protein